MDIKNLPNHSNGKLNGVEASDQSRSGTGTPSAKPSDPVWSDKVSLEQYPFRNNEELFAKSELNKFNHSSFEKLKVIQARLSEYASARQQSEQAAERTELGKMLNNPTVWEKIAERMAES